MKPLRPSKKWVLAVIGLLLALLIMKIVLLLIAKPKVTVDYVAEYNRTSRPQNYDTNENAAPYYQKAFDAFVEMPDKLQKPQIDWPTDFNDAEQAVLEQWLTSNSQAFGYFREALNKPYYWLDRKAKKENLVGEIMLPELSPFRELTKALIWNAKLSAVRGQFQHAFENILDCYRAGKHKCCPNLLVMEQHVGLSIKQAAIRNALIILDKSKVENKALKFLQDALWVELDNDAFIPSIQAEQFLLYDALQRTFIDNGKGTGRLAWSAGFYITLCAELDKPPLRIEWDRLKQRLYCCFIGPTRNEIVEQIEQVIATSDQIMTKTPWQVKNKGSDYYREIQDIKKSNFILEVVGVNPESTLHLYHKTRAQTEALIVILAVFRFKADTNRFPETLNELVAAGYIQSVAQDPYSDRLLVYKLIEDKLKLYSVGDNFKDDDGAVKLDIVYWPVQQGNMIGSPIYQKKDNSLTKRFGRRY